MTLIVTVLRSGGEYSSEHVRRLHSQFSGLPAICLSDVAVRAVTTIPLRYTWPGWFSKMELFNPEIIKDDILYFDLDTQIITTPKPYLCDDRFRMLSDFYYPDKPASGMMFIPHIYKARVWSAWMENPARWMRKCRGDQDIIEQICGRNVARFGNSVKSYKVHVVAPGMPGYHMKHSKGDGLIPPETDILCFHGKPRPWELV